MSGRGGSVETPPMATAVLYCILYYIVLLSPANEVWGKVISS